MSQNDAGVSAAKTALRHDWTREEIRRIYRQPLPDLLFSAQQAHREFHDPTRVQFCRLLSVKTGGCPEDCAYCPQSAHYSTEVSRGGLLPVDEVVEFAERARGEGATRFCMGAAWRQVQEGEDFENILEMVRRVAKLGMEVCCSLGMLDDSQAERLAEAGLTAYNHNLDTSPEFYGQIITTRNYDDRLRTLASVRKAGVTVCCGGIIGLGESEDDRIGLLHQLSTLDPHPESVPINALVRVAGTPLEHLERARSAGFRAHHCDGANSDAGFDGPAQRGAQSAFARGGRAVFCGRRQFALHRRKIADHSESRTRGRRGDAPFPRAGTAAAAVRIFP